MSDPLRITAQPLEVVARSKAVRRIKDLVAEFLIVEIVVGLPVSLDGGHGEAAKAARQFGAEVAAATGLDVTYLDERFTTVTAEKAMLEAGARRTVRRDNVDKVAAAIILRAFLDRSP
jgi:putative Holliday junction resolvase